MQIEEFPAKRSGEPPRLYLMAGDELVASAVWHANTQSYRVRVNGAMSWAKDRATAVAMLATQKG